MSYVSVNLLVSINEHIKNEKNLKSCCEFAGTAKGRDTLMMKSRSSAHVLAITPSRGTGIQTRSLTKLSSLANKRQGLQTVQGRRETERVQLPFFFCIGSAAPPVGAGDSVGRRASGSTSGAWLHEDGFKERKVTLKTMR